MRISTGPFRLTDKARQALENQAAAAGLSKARYIETLLLQVEQGIEPSKNQVIRMHAMQILDLTETPNE